jgi:hypothetical protein
MIKFQPPDSYFCKYKGHPISGVVARNCNYLLDLENFRCKHQDFCVAKEGLERFAQSLASCLFDQKILDDNLPSSDIPPVAEYPPNFTKIISPVKKGGPEQETWEKDHKRN